MQYDKITWEDSKEIYTEKNYSLARKGAGKFYHLFSHHRNQSLDFINDESQPGITINPSGLHNATIKVRDYAANEVDVRVVYSSDTILYSYESFNISAATCVV